MSTKVKTQKAKGVLFGLQILHSNFYGIGRFFKWPVHGIILDRKSIITNAPIPCFARPCPKKPRHGFVDSRVVKKKAAMLKLWDEIKKQDPHGELICGPYLPNVDYNAIYVSSGTLSIGKGNDGATAGKNSISFPVAPQAFSSDLRKKSGVTPKGTIYIETVHNTERWLLTQIREGPKLDPTSLDFIPKKVKIKEIVIPDDDLLKWEKQVKTFKTGTVVYGAGHTMASHAAIHCVLSKIPFISSFEPKVGDVLLPTKKIEVKLERKEFRKGVMAGLSLCNSIGSENILRLFYFSLSVLHNWAYISNSSDASWLLGAGSVVFAKICAALSKGEHRYISSSTLDRGTIYSKAIKNKSKPLYTLPKVFSDFYRGQWGQGFGGIPWAVCTWYSCLLWKNIIRTYNKNNSVISESEVLDIVSVINKTTNLAHNNGWWFNKIASPTDLDFIAQNAGLSALCVADVFFQLKKLADTIKVRKSIKKMPSIYQPFGETSDGRLMWAKAYLPLSKNLLINISIEGSKSYSSKRVKITEAQLKALKRSYSKTKGKYKYDVVLPIRAGNKAYIPGGKVIDIKKVFGVS